MDPWLNQTLLHIGIHVKRRNIFDGIVGTVYIFGAGATNALAQNAPLNDDLLREALNLRERDIARRMTDVRKFIFEFYPSAEHNIPLWRMF